MPNCIRRINVTNASGDRLGMNGTIYSTVRTVIFRGSENAGIRKRMQKRIY